MLKIEIDKDKVIKGVASGDAATIMSELSLAAGEIISSLSESSGIEYGKLLGSFVGALQIRKFFKDKKGDEACNGDEE